MATFDEHVNDCQNFYMDCVYRDFLAWFLFFSLTLGFSELAEPSSVGCCPAKCTSGFLGVTFRKPEFKWGEQPKTLLKLYM